MQTRLLFALLALSAAVVAAYAVPLLFTTADERTKLWEVDRGRDLDAIAAVVRRDPAGADRYVGTYWALYREPVVVVDGRRRVVLARGDLRTDDPPVAAALDRALRNERPAPTESVRPWSSRPTLMARSFGDGLTPDGAVVLAASPAAAAHDVGVRWAAILAGALAAATGFVLLARAVARWVLRPLGRLTHGVRAVGEGRRDMHVDPDSGPAELRELTASFNRMAGAVQDAADHQERLVADASHQMRNPVAALRLRVDALADDVAERARPDYSALLGEMDRLEDLLGGLLTMARVEAVSAVVDEVTGCDAGLVLADRADSWSPAARAADARLVVEVPEGRSLAVACPEGDVAQILDVAVDNALRYGAHRVCLTATAGADRVVVGVEDDGPGLEPEERRLAIERFWRGSTSTGPGSGLGLAIAAGLARRHDGELMLAPGSERGLAVRVALPRSPNGDGG